MTFRLGLFLGFGIGYVLGAKAGRERYEQIVRAVQSARRSEQGQRLEEQAREAASQVGETLGTRASEQMSRVTDLARGHGATGNGDASDTRDLADDLEATGPAGDPRLGNVGAGGMGTGGAL